MIWGRKIMRGLNSNIINFIKQDNSSNAVALRQIISDINGSNPYKLFLGIRDNYINIYYKGMSAIKVIFRDNGTIKEVLTHDKYFSGAGSKYKPVVVADLRDIIAQINIYLSKNVTSTKNSNHIEKEWQQSSVVENNASENVDWFCVDMEYIMERKDKKDPNYGRFDIIAISTEDYAPTIALIEVKVDTGAFASNGVDTPNLKKYKYINFNTPNCEKLGSGILGHFSNFIRYLNSTNYMSKNGLLQGRFNILKQEVYSILKNYDDLGLYPNIVPSLLAKVNCNSIGDVPEVVFLLLGNNNKITEIKDQLDKYVGNSILGRVPRDTIKNTWDWQTVLSNYNQPSSTINIKYVINIGKPSGKLFNGINLASANTIY